MKDKIRAAAEYVNACIDAGSESYTGTHNVDDYVNDAANIFAGSYDEYMTIWDALKPDFEHLF